MKADVFISEGGKKMRARLTTLERADNTNKKVFSAFHGIVQKFPTLMLSATVISAVLDTS